MRRQPWVRSGFEQAEVAADDQQRRRQGQRGDHSDEHADARGYAQAVEVRQPGERQAQDCAGDGQA